MDDAFTSLKSWIKHVHFHDGVTVQGDLQFAAIGTGEVDHRRAAQLLKEAQYKGFLSGEWMGWEPYEAHLPRELATMKTYEG